MSGLRVNEEMPIAATSHAYERSVDVHRGKLTIFSEDDKARRHAIEAIDGVEIHCKQPKQRNCFLLVPSANTQQVGGITAATAAVTAPSDSASTGNANALCGPPLQGLGPLGLSLQGAGMGSRLWCPILLTLVVLQMISLKPIQQRLSPVEALGMNAASQQHTYTHTHKQRAPAGGRPEASWAFKGVPE